MKGKMLVCVPFTGLGLYNGFRGNGWLRNRIRVFEQFVVPSLLNQTDRDFVLWVAWREEEKTNRQVIELLQRLQTIPNFKVVFTYSGIPMWDDKYEDTEARQRLFTTLRYALPDLFDYVPDCDEVYWLLQPSDDLYDKMTIESVKKAFAEKEIQAVSYTKGYVADYLTKKVRTYNPQTNPPFFAIKFPREIFFDPGKHLNYTGPYHSHEFIGDKLKMGYFEGRGFLVGIHQDNISTVFDHPYAGEEVDQKVWERFGVGHVGPLVIPYSLRKVLFHKLPYGVKRKLRYWSGEKQWVLRPLFAVIYNYLRA